VLSPDVVQEYLANLGRTLVEHYANGPAGGADNSAGGNG
jgi:hypothetical protein